MKRETEVNAQLIAAAPEMLEALTQIKELSGGYMGGQMGETVNAIAKVAIDRATKHS